MDEKAENLRKLIRQLQLAYSGELAAARAYSGHWRSVRNAEEKRRIRQIEEEEWHHRRLVGGILRDLGSHPRILREVRAFLIGNALALLCRVSGWFLPMYGAGKLESRNVREYEDAARYATGSDHAEILDCLLTMAEVEWEHEAFFRGKVERHAALRLFPLWPEIPPKETIRGRYTAPTSGYVEASHP